MGDFAVTGAGSHSGVAYVFEDGKPVLKKYDYAALLEKQAKLAEEEEQRPQIGAAALTGREIGLLAARYDPSHMTQREYNQLIDELLKKDVLGASETYGNIGRDRVVLRPGRCLEGGIVPGWGSAVQTLADAGGDALQLADSLLRQSESAGDSVRANAMEKILRVLREIQEARQDGLAPSGAKGPAPGDALAFRARQDMAGILR